MVLQKWLDEQKKDTTKWTQAMEDAHKRELRAVLSFSNSKSIEKKTKIILPAQDSEKKSN
jgi:hypothetical protein